MSWTSQTSRVMSANRLYSSIIYMNILNYLDAITTQLAIFWLKLPVAEIHEFTITPWGVGFKLTVFYCLSLLFLYLIRRFRYELTKKLLYYFVQFIILVYTVTVLNNIVVICLCLGL